MFKIIQLSGCILLLSAICSCKKLIEVDPPKNQLTTPAVLSDSTSATAALLNTYALFTNSIDATYSIHVSLYADELNFSNSTIPAMEFAQSSVTTTNGTNLSIWQNFYQVIYACNNLINHLSAGPHMTKEKVLQLSSEARFLRAYAYFYLTNLYGAVPLNLADDVNQSAHLARTAPGAVYQQIKQDLLTAQQNLSINYYGSGKVRANKLACSALLARVYLYQKDWINAEAMATAVISSGSYSLDPLNQVFLAGSHESILQFWTPYGFLNASAQLIPVAERPIYPLTPALLSAFEPGDLRKPNWTGSVKVGQNTYYFPYKYHNRVQNTSSPEYVMALRLGEQYLIRAEARLALHNPAGAAADINVIRARAGLPGIEQQTEADLLQAILHERRTELFMEWGHRLFDLQRLGLANTILQSEKPTWQDNTSLLLPIPQNEITYDANLSQNPGY